MKANPVKISCAKISYVLSAAIILGCGALAKAGTSGAESITPQSLPSVRFKPYTNELCQVTLSVPTEWSVVDNPDHDTVMKATSRSDGPLHGEVALSKVNGFTSEKDAASIIEHNFFAKMPGYKKLAEQTVIFGRQNLHGVSQTSTMTANGMEIWQRRFYFLGPDDNVISIAFTSPTSEAAKMQAIASNVVASVLTGKSANLGKSTVSNALSFSTYSSPAAGLSIAYPSGWKIESGGENNTVVKITGLSPSGKLGNISLHAAPATYLNAEEVARGIESDMSKNPEVSDFKTVRDESSSFGSTASYPGYMTESTFQYQGQKATQLSGYFNALNKHYVLTVSCFNWGPNEMRGLFSRVAGSIKPVDQ